MVIYSWIVLENILNLGVGTLNPMSWVWLGGWNADEPFWENILNWTMKIHPLGLKSTTKICNILGKRPFKNPGDACKCGQLLNLGLKSVNTSFIHSYTVISYH
jgi:hypothetical protein